jgi:hypothetical protein
MKYQILTISDITLAAELERAARQGFEFVTILEKILPNASSDFVGWRVLLRSVKGGK